MPLHEAATPRALGSAGDGRGGTSIDTRLIYFRCINPDHVARLPAPGQVTLHEERWAYCGLPIGSGGHSWQVIPGGLPYERVVRAQPPVA